MSKFKYCLITVSTCLIVTGCAGPQGMTNNQATGTGVGAATGAIAGAIIAQSSGVNPIVGALIGGVAGGIIGNAIGTALDEYEKKKLAEASYYAAAYAPTGQKIDWSGAREAPSAALPVNKKRTAKSSAPAAPPPPAAVAPTNPDVASGWIIPTTDIYQAADGRNCRDLQQVAVKSGKTYEQKVTACQSASGWDVPTNG